jgi:hypothetical protein
MSRKPVDAHLILIEGMEKWIKVVCYLILANSAFDLIITLPPEIANKIFDAIFKKLGL